MNTEIKNLYEFGAFRFDGEGRKLWQDRELILLSPKATELLCLLLERQGEYVSKEEIFGRVWAGTFVEDGVLTQNIYTLRKILGTNEDGQPLIENRTRRGYRITVPVRALQKSDGGFGAFTESKKEILFATQARMEIEEEITEYDASRTVPSRTPHAWTRIGIGIAFAVLLSIAGLSAYLFLRPQTNGFSHGIENVRFQKLTDLDNIFVPTISPDGNLIAYKKIGEQHVYVKDLRTNTVTRLETPNIKKIGFMQFSAGGDFLYVRNRGSFQLPANVYKVSRFGGEGTVIAENVWSGFSFSPDEKQMAFVRSVPKENRQSLILKNLETGDEREILTLNLPQVFVLPSFPAWSPDGKTLAVLVAKEQPQFFEKMVTIDVSGGKTQDIFIKSFRQVDQIVWLPKRDTFVASAREGKYFQVWEISRDGSQVRRLINDMSSYRWLMVSKDGSKLLTGQQVFFANLWLFDEADPQIKKQLTFGTLNRDGYYGIDYFTGGDIVYTSDEGESGDYNLWRINPKDNEHRQLTINAGSRNVYPAVSPDDEYIYFTSNRGGKSQIWRIEPQGENPQQITIGDSNESFPQVSPDGQYLYFIRKEKQSSAVWRKTLANGAEEKITDERFSPANILTLSPDGKYLGFHNVTDQINPENIAQVYQIAVIETANPQAVKFFSIAGSKQEIYWTHDSTAFDYLEHQQGRSDGVFRIKLDGESEAQVVRSFPNEAAFFITRSPDGKTNCFAHGQGLYDAVLLTDFQ